VTISSRERKHYLIIVLTIVTFNKQGTSSGKSRNSYARCRSEFMKYGEIIQYLCWASAGTRQDIQLGTYKTTEKKICRKFNNQDDNMNYLY
jgi:hypothetical protein